MVSSGRRIDAHDRARTGLRQVDLQLRAADEGRRVDRRGRPARAPPSRERRSRPPGRPCCSRSGRRDPPASASASVSSAASTSSWLISGASAREPPAVGLGVRHEEVPVRHRGRRRSCCCRRCRPRRAPPPRRRRCPSTGDVGNGGRSRSGARQREVGDVANWTLCLPFVCTIDPAGMTIALPVSKFENVTLPVAFVSVTFVPVAVTVVWAVRSNSTSCAGITQVRPDRRRHVGSRLDLEVAAGRSARRGARARWSPTAAAGSRAARRRSRPRSRRARARRPGRSAPAAAAARPAGPRATSCAGS